MSRTYLDPRASGLRNSATAVLAAASVGVAFGASMALGGATVGPFLIKVLATSGALAGIAILLLMLAAKYETELREELGLVEDARRKIENPDFFEGRTFSPLAARTAVEPVYGYQPAAQPTYQPAALPAAANRRTEVAEHTASNWHTEVPQPRRVAPPLVDRPWLQPTTQAAAPEPVKAAGRAPLPPARTETVPAPQATAAETTENVHL